MAAKKKSSKPVATNRKSPAKPAKATKPAKGKAAATDQSRIADLAGELQEMRDEVDALWVQVRQLLATRG